MGSLECEHAIKGIKLVNKIIWETWKPSSANPPNLLTSSSVNFNYDLLVFIVFNLSENDDSDNSNKVCESKWRILTKQVKSVLGAQVNYKPRVGDNCNQLVLNQRALKKIHNNST